MNIDNINTIFFDWHGVLENGSFHAMRESLVAKYPERESLRERIQQRGEQYARGEITSDDFWSFLAEVTSAEDAILAKNARFQFDPNEKLWEMLPDLSKKYDIYILSDCPDDKAEFIREKYDLSVFNGVYFSYEFGKTKRDPTFFTDVLTKTKAHAESSCMVDDSERKVKVAKELKFQTILFRNASDLQQLL